MQPEQKRLTIEAIFFLIASLLASGVIVSLYIRNNYSVKDKSDVFVAATENIIAQNPLVQLYRESALVLVLSWKNLPLSARTVNIYRSLTNQNSWVKWKTIVVNEFVGVDGFIKIEVFKASDIDDYEYYIQILDQSGATIVETHTPILLSLPPQSPITPPSPGTTGPTAPTTTSPPPPTSKTTYLQITSPTPSSKSTPPPKNIYYTPDGKIAGYQNESNDKFRIAYINKSIEIAWGSFSEQFDTLVISRSNNPQGPWFNLIQQTSVDANKSHFFRLVDNSFYQDYYYRLELILNSIVVATYGPVFLPKFE